MSSVEVAAKNTCPVLGEGPHWVEATQELIYVDIHGHQVHRLDTKTGTDSVVQLDDEVHFVIPKDDGNYVISKGQYIAALEWDTETVTNITGVEIGTENYPNDAKCDAMGRLWTGTMGPPLTPARESFHPNRGSVYSYDGKTGLRHHMDGVTVSNGLGWTADNKTMFYADSIPGTLYAFDFNVQEGTIENKRIVLDFSADPSLGYPDGLCVDNNDHIWVAGYGASKVHCIDPHTGEVLRSVIIPATRITSCCFGGPDYSDLYVTCGNVKGPDENMPLSGSVFRVSGLGIKGRPAFTFKG